MATQELRRTILQDSDTLTFKQRFGLFSQPISTAVGDDGPYKDKIRKNSSSIDPRNEMKKPLTQPRNVQVRPNRNGQVNSSFFSPMASLAASNVTDTYIDVGRRLMKEEHDTFHKGNNHQATFKPASGRKSLAKSAYEYAEDKPLAKDPRSHRNQEGQVIVEARNVQTSPTTKVEKNYFKFPKYIEDPYGRERQLECEQRKIAKSKEPEQPFKQNLYGPRLFNKSIKVYGEDVKLEAKPPKETKFNIMPHEAPFLPSHPNKHGLYGFLAPFPEYKENPPVEKKRSASKEGGEKKDAFKRMNADLSRPTPSISTHPINMRKYISHSFSHRM